MSSPSKLTRPQTRPRFGIEAEPLERRVLLADTAGLASAASTAPEHVPTPSDFDIRYMTPVNGKVFFTAFRGGVGRELWVTDGTQGGTRMVKDIVPGPGGSMPSVLTNVDGTLFFFANDVAHGWELWKSDGTEAATVMVKDIYPGTGSSNDPLGQPDPTFFVFKAALPGLFIFTTNKPQRELWRSDGTAEGTYRLKEAGEIDDAYPYVQTKDIGPVWESHGLAYFTGSDPVVGGELWVTEGTVAGTRLLKDVRPGKDWSIAGGVVEGAGGITYFTARTGGTDAEPVHSLFRTDGTEAGTRPIFDGPISITGIPLGGFTYFVPTFPNVQPTQLWRTDGTTQGTVKVTEFPTPQNMASVNLAGTLHGQLLLYAYTPQTGWENWLSDGTEAGTHTVLETPGPADTQLSQLSVANDQLYFFKDTPGMGLEPYRSDGTAGGTVLLKDIVPGPTGSGVALPQPFLPVAGGKVVFPAQSAEPVRVVAPWGTTTYSLHDLFVTDGTPAGTEKLETVPPVRPPASVVGRNVFYNNSGFDGENPAANAADDGAIASDKRALLPGQAASFANVTSYTKGLNGVMIDIAGMPDGPLLGTNDFDVRSGNSPTPSTWDSRPSLSYSVRLRRGAGTGGSDRVTLTWPDNANRNTWLQVTVLATDDTGLAQPDVFYFGNLVGETGDSASPMRLTALDLTAVRRAMTNAAQPVTNPADVNRDRKVNALDLAAVRGGYGNSLIAITAPPTSAAAPASPQGATSLLREGPTAP